MITLDQQFVFREDVVRWGRAGAGPDLVLVHGTPWSSQSWRRLLPLLTPYYRVTYFDLVGYGKSDMRDAQRVSLDIQGELLAALINHWDLKNPVVVGHDFGGAISLRAHLLHDSDFAALVLMNVVAIAPWGSPFFAHVQQHESAFAGVPGYIHEAIVRAYITGALHGDPDGDILNMLVEPWIGASGQAAFYRQIAQADQRYTDEFESKLSSMRCPIAVLWGEQDEWIPIQTGRRLHDLLPGSEFTPVPQAGHLVQLDAPEAVARSMMRFLATSS